MTRSDAMKVECDLRWRGESRFCRLVADTCRVWFGLVKKFWIAREMDESDMSCFVDDPQNCMQQAVMMAASWMATWSSTVFLCIQPGNSCLLAMRSVHVMEKLWRRMPFVWDEVFLPSTKAKLLAASWRRKPCLGDVIWDGRYMVTLGEVWEIHGMLGKGVDYQYGHGGLSGLRSWMQSWWTCSMSSVSL